MVKEFAKFLKEFNVLSLAVGFVMGTASTALVNSLVKDMLLPIATSFVSDESWKNATFNIGKATIAYGSFLAELFNFLILAVIIFVVAKKILNMNTKAKK